MDPTMILQWGALIQMAVSLGVKSWQAIHDMASSAGLDDAQIQALKPKWDALYDDVARAAEGR